MIKTNNIKVMGFLEAIKGMRHPLKSYERSDTDSSLGQDDYELAIKLIKAGTDHSKFMRQIFISCDITGPEYFWKQFATYKVGTVENSTSQMHTIMKNYLTLEDFTLDNYDLEDRHPMRSTINYINDHIDNYRVSGSALIFREIIQLIPQSFNYTKYCTFNYAVLRNMYHSRKNHKLTEWHEFLDQILNSIPNPEMITTK